MSETPYVGFVHYEPRGQTFVQHRTNMTQRDEVQKFEQGRIRVLQEERLYIQKKTFTKWMNSFLQKVRMEVDDLFVDLADGKKLLKLLEIISGEKLAKPNNGKMRVHKIENVNKSLAFLHTKVRLESIGAEDIVDGNPRLILGLIWTIILRFQIQEIEIDVDEENESSEKKSAKDALLLWAQRKTQGYKGVDIRDFSTSWRTGLGFNALIHAHRPDLFTYDDLVHNRNIDNLNHAFDVANNELGIPRLLDAEDIDNSRPDEKSIMTYVASYYHTFARMKNEEKSGRRIAKIIKQMVDADKMKVNYDELTTDLLNWIKIKIVELEDRNFPNSLEGIQTLFLAFARYRTKEKPPKYIERSEIEALFFNINTQLKELRQPAFIPPDGKLVQDIERAWETLERAEHNREVALRNELLRQERLEQLYCKFERKSVLREGYVKEMIQVLSDPRYGSNRDQVDATVKKHEAISADILARQERVNDLTQMCNELVREKYRNSDRVVKREAEILNQWKQLLDLLEKHKLKLNRMVNIKSLEMEIDTTLNSMQQLKADLSTTDTGIHLMAVEELLHKHALQELQVSSLGETERRLNRLAESTLAQNPQEEKLKKKIQELSATYKDLQDASDKRKGLLEEARNFYQFLQDQEDEEAWLIEKQRICQAGITAKDLRGVLSLQQKHKVLMDEIKARRNKFDQLGATGRQLIAEKHPRSNEIQQHMDRNKQAWSDLEKLVNDRTKQLQDAAETYQFYADANEADSWLNEKTSILNSSDYGSDEPSAQALLQRHKDLEGELNAYKGDILSLNTQADRLIASGISNLDLTAEVEVAEPVEEIVYENRMIPTEVWVEEPVEKVEYKMVVEEKKVPQVKALYPFNDHGLNMVKGEVMYLLNKSNPDWWCVRKADGTDGFAPAKYVTEIEPRLLQMQYRKPETVKVMQKVKKTKMVNQKVPVKVFRQRKPVKRKVDDNDSVPKRQKKINDTYQHLLDVAAKRHALLEDAVKLFRFYKECDDFEKWIKDKEKLLAVDDPNDSIEQAKRKYEKFVTDLSANNKRMDELNDDVKEFEKQKHSQIDKIKSRHRQVQGAWQRLNLLKARKEKSLEGASSVELFQKTCDEARDWMLEKMTQLDTHVSAHDLKTVQALQRRHDNLERELAPVEEKVTKVMHLANSVKSAYPNERQNVARRQDEIEGLWRQVKDKASERRARLENAVGEQIFTNSCKDLLRWVADVKDQLNADNMVRDVQTAEALLKNHKDLGEEIKAKNDEFYELTDLGKKLLKSNPELPEVAERIERLTAEQAAIGRGWKEKQRWLDQCHQLQLFNREADNIDAATSAHQAFLEFSDLGNSLDEVEALQKQHKAFANTLFAQDDRVNLFSKKADALIADDHYESKGIDDKRNEVLQRRQAVKDLCQQRTNVLDASKNYQEFCAEVHDLRSWLNEKLKTASDESYRDLTNLERKLQKHEAFERELRANEGQLRTVNKLGQALIAQDSYRKDDVAKTLKELNDEWQQLVGLSLEKGRRLRQAVVQHDYNTSIDDIQTKLDEINENLCSTNVGTDLRSCRDLLKRQDVLETELGQCAARVDELVNKSNDMMHDGHFDADAIRQKALDGQKRLKQLEEPARKRRDVLEEALKFYNFHFELDAELQWIKEHLPLASSATLGQNLHQAQNLFKKHKKLEAEIVGHQPAIDKTLQAGQTLVDLKHPESAKIKDLCGVLQDAWDELNEKASERAQKLELSLKAQQFFFEANEVESWLNEKADILASTDYGRDRDSATKLLTKHKALELELDTYNNIIVEMGRGAQNLIQNKHPDSKLIAERQSSLEHLVRSLQRKAVLRQHHLMESLFRHEYFLESEELDRWIAENLQQASSEDYGQDYEHLLILQAKFDDLKHRIEAGAERFRQCEDLAQKLIANESSYISDIQKKQLQLETLTQSDAVEEVRQRHDVVRQSWQKLHDQMQNREQRLLAAGEIHRFHRDVADAMQRIQEKSAALGTDLGRDLNSALTLLRKHEAFENELVALEAQLQVLVEDGSKLQKIYPSNQSSIQLQQEVVIDAWDYLKERAELRHDQLQASVDLQKFLTQVRNLTNWATALRLDMQAEENVRSIARAQFLRNEHEGLKNEIEAREADFKDVAENLTAMEQTGHYAANEAGERYKNLLQERERLHADWQIKKIHLDQLCDLHMLLREAKLIEDATNAQEATLSNLDFGETVDEVANQVKKHEEFEKLIVHQDEKFDTLVKTGQKLIGQQHFDSKNIAKRLQEVGARRQQVHQLSDRKKQLLADALLYAEFNRDVGEAQIWIAEKQKKLEKQVKTGEVTNLDDKIKELQKHQAFQAEIAANEGKIKEVKSKGETLLAKKHKASKDIEVQLRNLDDAWRQLLREVDSRGKGLEEAQDILEFNNQLDKIESWIRDKEVMIQAGDVGKDYEHCQALQRKLDDVDSDMRIDDTRIKTINSLANKLAKQGHPGVQQRRDNFIKKWQDLQGALAKYRNKLAAASEVHLFDRDVADTAERINEKLLAMETDDVGRSLPAVELLSRKQEALESEMTAVENKLQDHGKDAVLLSDKYPHAVQHLQGKMEELQNEWEKLIAARERRRNNLKGSHARQKFLSDVKDLEQWVSDTTKRMEAHQPPSSVNEAETLLGLHDELKAEINGRNEVFAKLINFGRSFSESDDSDIIDGVNKLKELQSYIQQAWEQHKDALTYEYDLQDFKEQANQLNNWLADKEAFLNNDDVGDTPRAVEALIRKHEVFETMLTQPLSRIDELSRKKVGGKTPTDPTYANSEVATKLNEIMARKNRLLGKAAERKKILHESKALQKFLKNEYDVEVWLNHKLQIATDENYREPYNLQNKIQKHVTFEAEVFANHERVTNVIEEGRDLIENKHYASKDIADRIEELENRWKELIEQSHLKRDRLNEAYQALLFNRSLDEFEAWLLEVEAQLTSTDVGKDLATVNNLLKKHTILENDIQQHTDNCETINDAADQFVKNNHFMSEEIQQRAQDAITRFHQLKEPVQQKRDLLEGSMMLQQFTRDVEDELQWLADREPLAASRDLGASLTAVQSLHKKHQALEAELSSREPIIGSLVGRANSLARSGHVSAPLISQKAKELQQKFASIRDLASIRRLRLQDALEVQTYYEEATEAEAWMRDKRPSLVTREVGKDEDSAESLKRKLEATELEIKAFEVTIKKLKQSADELIERQHYDAVNIEKRKNQLDEQFNELRKLVSEREVRLDEALRYFTFVRECLDVQEWMKDQILKTDSEEYGNDVEHVELLIQAFDTFHASLMNSEPRIQSCIQNGNILIEAKSSHSPEVQQKVADIRDQWDDLLELANARKDALAGAKRVHVFDRTAEEIISWIQEKKADLSYDTFGQDLESIQDLLRKHQALENEMKVIREKVENVEQEGEKLINEFPDTKEHIDDKCEDMLSAWGSLQTEAARRKDHLQQAEQLQAYFDQFQDLLAWITEMVAKITAPDLPNDCNEAELLIERHKEYKVEISAKSNAFKQFYDSGNKFIEEGHLFASEIQDKIKVLRQRLEFLNNTWEKRNLLYNQNLDVLLFKREADILDNWLAVREGTLKEGITGDSIHHVEDLIRKHGDFEEAVKAQEDKFEALKRKTLIEDAFLLQREQEALAKKAEKERQEQERLEHLKRLEIQKINEKRRQERPQPPEIVEELVNGTKHEEEGRPVATVRKTNSVVQTFERDRGGLRRGSDSAIQRSASMKVGTNVTGSKPKRTPTFTTRRRPSFKSKPTEAPPADAQSFLDRKQLTTANGKRATNRTWKNSYTVLCGQLLCFFKNRDDFAASKASGPPVNVHNAMCSIADDYQKKKHTFRLELTDGSEFLFACSSDSEMDNWIQKISFRARLPPSQQLLHLEIPKDQNDYEMSSQSSRTSSPDVADQVVLRHDPQSTNGSLSSLASSRHTMGESPPPLPMSEPPNNYAGHRQYTLENSGSIYDGSGMSSKQDWQPNVQRPQTMQPNDAPKSRLFERIFKKKRNTSQM
ncbi:spectrin alpha chain, non-erythrocytic 1 isoform X2 [Tribolium castaneum]|uniref:spectrin alpha chain, non-erythrocytic 1 isoform X2 n=1 Tax=Tribolium castaneum TaxID=7070 RepID=UPI00046C3C05|nr:PREDICTED: spectrin alpha chain, non-erythrocytic 1 isoform X3 [Tribolium castaneum]|eukprot:XP_008201528.1 PREDICTED: spectrin alpha chain, non-erythrocytic 1 isoform X3 [Tribolium castaneum]